MGRRLTASAVFGLGLLAVSVMAQSPASDPTVKRDKQAEKKVEKKAADPLDALIGAALAHDADVQVARAKVQLADAELTKARQAATLKAIAAQAAVQAAKAEVEAAEYALAAAVARVQRDFGPARVKENTQLERIKLEAAKAKLAQIETELKLLTGGNVKTAAGGWDDLTAIHKNTTWQASCLACHTVPAVRGANDPATASGLLWLSMQQRMGAKPDTSSAAALAAWIAAGARPESVKGPVADRLRAALDKPVKLGAKDEEVAFDKALEVFKRDAGLDVPVRVRFAVKPVTSLGEELPVGAWMQLFADANHDTRIVVREYGLLWTGTGVAPPDAVSVFDFWKQKPEPKKPDEPKKAVEPKPPTP